MIFEDFTYGCVSLCDNTFSCVCLCLLARLPNGIGKISMLHSGSLCDSLYYLDVFLSIPDAMQEDMENEPVFLAGVVNLGCSVRSNPDKVSEPRKSGSLQRKTGRFIFVPSQFEEWEGDIIDSPCCEFLVRSRKPKREKSLSCTYLYHTVRHSSIIWHKC